MNKDTIQSLCAMFIWACVSSMALARNLFNEHADVTRDDKDEE